MMCVCVYIFAMRIAASQKSYGNCAWIEKESKMMMLHACMHPSILHIYIHLYVCGKKHSITYNCNYKIWIWRKIEIFIFCTHIHNNNNINVFLLLNLFLFRLWLYFKWNEIIKKMKNETARESNLSFSLYYNCYRVLFCCWMHVFACSFSYYICLHSRSLVLNLYTIYIYICFKSCSSKYDSISLKILLL